MAFDKLPHVSEQGWLYGRVTCAVTQSLEFRKTLLLVECSAVPILKLVIICFKQGAPPLHFTLGLANDVAGLVSKP